MSACIRFRRWIAAAVDHELGPAASLDLARHLDACRSCKTERARQERLASELDRMPFVEEPEDLSSRILARVRSAMSGGRSTGACVALVLALAGAAAASLRAPGIAGDLLPRFRFGLDALFDGAVAGFGRAAVFLFSEAASGPGAIPRPNAGSSTDLLHQLAPLGLCAIVILLSLTVLLALTWNPAVTATARLRPKN